MSIRESTHRLHRAGIILYSKLEDKRCAAESILIPRYRAEAATSAAALQAYEKLIQEPQQWRMVAVESLPYLVNLAMDEEEIKAPMDLWVEISG